MKDFCVRFERIEDLKKLQKWCREMKLKNVEEFGFVAINYYYGVRNGIVGFDGSPFTTVYSSFDEFLYSKNLEEVLE